MSMFGGSGGGGTVYPKIPRDDPAAAQPRDKPGTRYTLTPQQHMAAAQRYWMAWNVGRTGAGMAPGTVAQANVKNKNHYASLYGVQYKDLGTMRKVGRGVTANKTGAAGTLPGSGGDEIVKTGDGTGTKKKGRSWGTGWNGGSTFMTDTGAPPGRYPR